MKKEELIKFLAWYSDFREKLFSDEHLTYVADEYLNFLKASALKDKTTKVITNEDKKEELKCEDISETVCLNHPDCTGCPAYDK